MDDRKKAAIALGGAAVVGTGLTLFFVLRGKSTSKKAKLIGTVVSGEDNLPIIGASVLVGEKEATTDANGVFTISELPIGPTSIDIAKTGYITYSGSIILIAGDNQKTFQLFKTPTAAGLTGKVTNEITGQPVSGVTVSASGKTATTDSSGNYSLTGLTAGTVQVSFSKQWYATKTFTVTLQAGSNTYNATLNNYGTVTGRVIDSSTSAYLSGVTLTASTGQTATTNASGQYSIYMPSGPANITASKTGYQSQTQPVTPEPGVTKPLDFSLVQEFTQTGIVQGTVSDSSNNNPIVGASLTFTGPDQVPHTTTSGTAGAYSIELPSDSSLGGIPYNITATKSGYYNYTGSQGVRTGAYHTKNIPMAPVPVTPGAVHGYVVDQQGNPIYNARIDLNPTDLYDMTSGDGFYDMENVPPGDYEIWANKSGYTQQVKQIHVYSGQVTNVPNFVLPPEGGGIGFFMQVDFNQSDYPTAAIWWAQVQTLYLWFESVDTLWDMSNVNLGNYTWPATLTVELYDAQLNLLKRNTKSVTLVNGHVYSFLVNNAGGQLIDNGLY